MVPQPLGVRTNQLRHRVKQGVKLVPKLKKVERQFIMPNGEIKAENELTPEEKAKFAQKVLDAITPLLYDAVMRDVQREKEALC